MESGDWQQSVIEFTDRRTAEQVAVQDLRPALAAAQAEGLIAGWFFTRKHPCWRLRYLPADSRADGFFADVLDGSATEGRIIGWTAGIYEPETFAFGGAAAMDVAHELFSHDSRHILDYLARPSTPAAGARDLGRRELAILLCSVLLRGAGTDWYEQGDVWARVTQHRPAERTAPPAERLHILRPAVHRLMTVDASPASRLVDGGPLAAIGGWSAAFERAGQQLADLARRGTLERGLRAILTHHVIFFWNRLGLSYAEQATLATLAKEVVMAEQEGAVSAPETPTGRMGVSAVDTEITEETPPTTAERLRDALADRLRDQGTVRTGRVEAAIRAVPRHLFVPTVPLEEAYTDEPVYTKHDGAGMSISAASQPTIVAMMLEQLRVQPGHRVLEIGAGTGYNAGLLAYLVGDDGQITTIDVDDDIVAGARAGLAAADWPNVRVILGDGVLGYADGAPYDRVIATVGAFDLPPAWLEQLAPHGRLVVPLRLRGSVSRSIVFERAGGHWASRSSAMCTFMPLRGIADDARRIVPLTPDGAVSLHTHQEQAMDASTLTGILDHPRSEAWTGVLFGAAESFEWLDLWLTCTMDNALHRMPVQRSAIDSGLVTPQFGWGAMAVTDKGDLAYLTLRPAERTENADGGTGRLYEVGVISHGPGSDELASRVVDEIRTWDRDHRSRAVQIEIQPVDARERITGQFTFGTPRNRLVISWN
ncbi:O-methyltransferase [Candidatus Protofrankia californiensis]|uniref:Protein-L-isoaspartate O-methyltransferase n=1 Tax=Candidatus Protofrankia californiensis TaxID=1839754 RepID=A0A1C3NYB0_9ACTN|nr:O-methyltransferase [Candidatus Protofrankia californiensis]